MATTVKLRQLIDMSIGSPEPGHVNFCALHCLLSCIAQKLNIMDETVDISTFNQLMHSMGGNKKSKKYNSKHLFSSDVRLPGGQDVEEVDEEAEAEELIEVPEEAPNIAIMASAADEANADNEVKAAEAVPAEVVVQNDTNTSPPTFVITEVDDSKAVDIPVQEDEKQQLIQPDENKEIDQSAEQTIDDSRSDISIKTMDILRYTVHNLEVRLLNIEQQKSKEAFTEDMAKGFSIMKDQVELCMSHVLLLTYLTLSKEPDLKNLKQLYALSKQLRNIQKSNVYSEGGKYSGLDSIPSLQWDETNFQLEPKISELGLFEIGKNNQLDNNDETVDDKEKAHQERELEAHLCYSPEKLLNQLMDLKTDFCLLVNKVNEISARILMQESQQTLTRIQELQDQMHEVHLTNMNFKAQQDLMEVRISQNSQGVENNKKSITELSVEKVDKTELEILLADKVDYNQLQRKVSLDQMLEMQCRMDKKFCEIIRQITENDKKMHMLVENLRDTLGFTAIEGILNTFKEQITTQVHNLEHLIQEYIDSTNDECAAAGARVKVLQNLACLSCDTTCVMRTAEAKVSKLPNATPSNSLSPLITYELGSIRKSGIMGYYRKDDFPHAPNAWMNRQSGNFSKNAKPCVPRHAGGPHTASTPRERVEKIMLNKK